MAIINGTVEAALNPNKWGKFAMLIDDVWYSTNPEWLEIKPNKGDTVSFDDKGKKYIHNLVITDKGAGGPVATGSTGKGGSSYSSLGVELGHAANVATSMANQRFAGEGVGSDDWYKYFITHTQKVYATMKKIRQHYETPVEVEEATLAPVTVLSKPSPELIPDDIFAA